MINYLLSYDFNNGSIPDSSVSAFVKSNRYIEKWSLLYPGAFFLKCNGDMQSLDQTLTDFFRPTRYVLSMIGPDIKQVDGWLDPEIWDWLDDDEISIEQLGNRSSQED